LIFFLIKNSSLIPLIEIDKEHKDGVKVVCGPGTGLGIAMLLPIGSGNY
jgi:glucokinase